MGSSARVEHVQLNGLLYRRLLDLGFVAGAKVQSVMASPSGDPTVYRVRGSQVALRKQDAAMVYVDAPEARGRPGPAARNGACAGCYRRCELAEANSHAAAGAAASELTVALAGNPNTGKSTVFNALTGLRQHVGNWPGKTVTRAEGTWRHDGHTVKLIDLPGTYSLLSNSVEEEIARDFIVFARPDCTVVVIDATCIERNLNLVLQILQISGKAVVCVNLMDEARRKGIAVDLEGLELRLGVPVVGTVARTGKGLDRLREKVAAVARGEIATRPIALPCDAELEGAVEQLARKVAEVFPEVANPRWVALRLIDGADKRLIGEVEAGTLGGAFRRPVHG